MKKLEKEKIWSAKAEESLLSCIILNEKILPDVLKAVDVEDFYKENHKVIFEAIKNMKEDGIGIEPASIIEYLKSVNLYEEAGGENYIYDLGEVVSISTNAMLYAARIKELSVKRKISSYAGNILRNVGNKYSSVESIISDAEKKINEISRKNSKNEIAEISDLAVKKLETLDKYKNGEIPEGISSGFDEVDKLLSGFHESDLMILAARPAMGKTAFALNLALSVAKQGKHVLIFSLEMGTEQLYDRILSAVAGIKLTSLRNNKTTDEDMEKIGTVFGRITEMPIHISDASSPTTEDIKSAARKLRHEGRLDFLLIDYLQLISPESRSGFKRSREQEISEISRSLKLLAKELKIPILALSQLSRGVEQRMSKRPMLSDLRESGAIEQDADIVMFIYRDSYYNKDEGVPYDEIGEAEQAEEISKENAIKAEETEIIISKHRNGPCGTAKVAFEPEFQRFSNIRKETEVDEYLRNS